MLKNSTENLHSTNIRNKCRAQLHKITPKKDYKQPCVQNPMRFARSRAPVLSQALGVSRSDKTRVRARFFIAPMCPMTPMARVWLQKLAHAGNPKRQNAGGPLPPSNSLFL